MPSLQSTEAPEEALLQTVPPTWSGQGPFFDGKPLALPALRAPRYGKGTFPAA